MIDKASCRVRLIQRPVLKTSPYLLWSASTSFLYFSRIGCLGLLSFFTMTLGSALFSKRLETEDLGSAPNILFIKSVNIIICLILIQILGFKRVRMIKTLFGKRTKNNALRFVCPSAFSKYLIRTCFIED